MLGFPGETLAMIEDSIEVARQMDLEWVREIRDRCSAAGVSFFLKQLGGRKRKRGGDEAVLDGKLWRAFPEQPSLSTVLA